MRTRAHGKTGPRRVGTAPCLVALTSSVGCAPTANVLGVYFPAWLTSGMVGLVVAYTCVWLLGRRSQTRQLAQSGLLFCSLTVTVGFFTWWAVFGRF